MGGHVIVGLSKQEKAPPGLATWSRIKMSVGGHVHVCMYVRDRSLGLNKSIVS